MSKSLLRFALPVCGVGAFLITWEALTQLGILSRSSIPPFSQTITRLGALVLEPRFYEFLSQTLMAWLAGLGLAVVIALPLGVLLGLNRWAYRLVAVPIEAIRPVPPIVVLPLALLVLGGGLGFQATLIVQGAMWPLLITVMYAIRASDRVSLETARVFRLGKVRTLFQVRMPAAVPMIASGLRISAATAFAVTIVTELLGGAKGLGTLLTTSLSGGDITSVYALTLVAGILGLGIAASFARLEKSVSGWGMNA